MPVSASAKPEERFDLLAPLREARAWRVAVVVGSLINVYGQLLVPWLNGQAHPLRAFTGRASAHPGTMGLSLLLGYLFPLGVSVYSAAAARGTPAPARNRSDRPVTGR